MGHRRWAIVSAMGDWRWHRRSRYRAIGNHVPTARRFQTNSAILINWLARHSVSPVAMTDHRSPITDHRSPMTWPMTDRRSPMSPTNSAILMGRFERDGHRRSRGPSPIAMADHR
jgi:hypothetical protein